MIAFFFFVCYNTLMDKNSKNEKIKYFPYKLTPVLLLLCALVILLCIAGIAVTVYRMILNGGVLSPSDFLKYPFLIGVCIFCITIIVALLIKSQYYVTSELVVTQFGFIKTKYLLKDVTEIEHDRDTHKLTVKFGEQFCVISCASEWDDDFVHAILQANPNIEYSYTLTENKPQNGEEN